MEWHDSVDFNVPNNWEVNKDAFTEHLFTCNLDTVDSRNEKKIMNFSSDAT